MGFQSRSHGWLRRWAAALAVAGLVVAASSAPAATFYVRTGGNNAIVEGIFFDVAPKTTRNVSFRLTGATAQGAQLQVSGDAGLYTIQSSSDMVSWTNVGAVELQSSPVNFTDTNNAAVGLRVYRAAP